jgi:hypothetical protein
MSAGARPGTILEQIEAEFHRLTGQCLFFFAHWYAEQMRALRAYTEAGYGTWPAQRAEQERLLLQVLKATPKRTP